MAGTGAGAGARPGTPAAAGLRGRRQVLGCMLFCWLCEAVSGQIQYSIPEEMKRGSIVGNLAKDLGLNTRDLSDRKLRVVSPPGDEYFTVNAEVGTLLVNDRIDREKMCGESPSCSVTFQAVVENPLNVYNVEVLIQDINDNTPSFLKDSIDFEIVEFTLPGTRFALVNARDPDIGINSLQGYKLSNNQHFVLEEKKSNTGYTSAELVLQKVLDRETQSHHHLTLTASDGGEPIRSSTVIININVLDANDNFPVFSQESYRVSISEGAPNNSVVLQVKATDSDEGINSQITYFFSSISDNALHVFSLDSSSGEIKVKQPLDFENDASYKIAVGARDGGGLVTHCEVFIEVTDENDNAPELTFTSVTSPVPEDSPLGTVVALINVNDRDSGENGEVTCHIQEQLPFNLISLPGKFYKLVTTNALDRENVPEYNIKITATDKGSHPLFTIKTVQLQLSDINDNTPVFEKSSYQVYISENNVPGTSIYRIKANDVDLDQNARITYSIVNNMEEVPLSSYISINSQTGVIYAQRSYDYERIKEFHFQVKAQDSGSPTLSSNVTVRVSIVDQNDNSPAILYPTVGADGSVPFEMVPQSSDLGYLITKVVAVDADSGHNAWLSYHLLQVPEQSLFKIGLHTGEIRTSRAFLEKDLMKHKAVIMVKDNGQPRRSATVTLNLVLSDGVQEALPEISNTPLDMNDQSNLKVYLAVALALISFLFILTLMIVVVLKCRKPKGPLVFDSLTPALYSHIDPRFTSNYQNGTLSLPYSYEVAVALDSGENKLTLLKPKQEVPTDILFSPNDSGIGPESLGEAVGNEGLKQAANYWNSLPNDLKSMDKFEAFKKKLKTHLFDAIT